MWGGPRRVAATAVLPRTAGTPPHSAPGDGPPGSRLWSLHSSLPSSLWQGGGLPRGSAEPAVWPLPASWGQGFRSLVQEWCSWQ